MNNKWKMRVEESFEYKGYGIIADFLQKINDKILKFGSYFGKKARNLRFEQYKMHFGQRNDDIYITTYPKSGTTMMQMIMYQLTTNGEINFNHIYDVSPWIKNDAFRSIKPRQLPSPRLIKTHDYYKSFPKETKGRFIVVHRDGQDVAVSYYNQQKNYNLPDLKFDTFLKSYFKSKSWFKFSKGWFENKNKFPILYIKYEDLLENKHQEIMRIVNFLKLDVTEQQIEKAIEYSSFAYMKENEHLFGDKPTESKKVYNQFIRKGVTGEGENKMNDEQKHKYDKIYKSLLEKAELNAFAK